MNRKEKTDWSQYPVTLTVHQSAEVCGCCDRTILNKLRSGELQGVKLGRSWRISKEYLRRLIDGERPLDPDPEEVA